MVKTTAKKNEIKTFLSGNQKWIAVVVVVVILIVLFIPKTQSVKKCNDLDCFVSNADECNSTTYLETTDFGTVKYSVSVNSTGCVLTKEIVELNESEDSFLKNALRGKKMQCVYSKRNFNGQWIISLIEGLEDCQGDLKDAIANLLLLT